MTQGPFQVDVLQIQPSLSGMTTISRDPSGPLKFTDTLATSGLFLSQLANLGTIAGVLIVGTSGVGAGYTTIQSAINAIPSSSSATNPYLILVMPGVYNESLTLTRDGVSIVGIGLVTIVAPSTTVPLTIQGSVGSTPLVSSFKNLNFSQTQNSLACVSIVGGAASTVGSTGIYFEDCNFSSSGVGGYSIYASIVNNIYLNNCSLNGSTSSTVLYLVQVAGFQVYGGSLPLVQISFDAGSTLPSVGVTTYVIQNCLSIGNSLITLTSAGGIKFLSCPQVGNLTVVGNQEALFRNCNIGTISVDGTVFVDLHNTSFVSATGPGTMNVDQLSGSSPISSASSVAVVFPVARADANYTVSLDPGISSLPWVSVKAATGFTIQFGGSVSTTVAWTVLT